MKTSGNSNNSTVNCTINESKIVALMHNLFIKAAIHFKENNELIGSLFLFFSKLCELGNEFTLLMNTYRIFGFIMEIVIEKSNDYIRALSCINIQTTKQLPAELDNYNFIEGKKSSSKFENMRAYNYLFLLFKTIVLRTKYFGYYSSKNLEPNYELSNLEENYKEFLLSEDGLDLLFNYCFMINGQRMKIASNKLTSALAHLTYDNEKSCDILFKFLPKKIYSIENERIKPYLLCFSKKLKHPGKFGQQLVLNK